MTQDDMGLDQFFAGPDTPEQFPVEETEEVVEETEEVVEETETDMGLEEFFSLVDWDRETHEAAAEDKWGKDANFANELETAIHQRAEAAEDYATGQTIATPASWLGSGVAGWMAGGLVPQNQTFRALTNPNFLSKLGGAAKLTQAGAQVLGGATGWGATMAAVPAAYEYMKDPKGNTARLGDDLGVNQSTNVRENIEARQTAPSKAEAIVAPAPRHELGIADRISPPWWDNAHQTDPSFTGQAKNLWHDLTRGDWDY